VIPQLTADTMRHRRTTNVPFPMGKNEENEEIQRLWLRSFAGCTLERPQCLGRRRTDTFTSTSPVQRAVATPRARHIDHQTDTVHGIHVLIQRVYQTPHFAVDLRRPICLSHSSPGRRPRRAWFQSHKCLLCEVERLGLHLTALETLGIQQQQTAALPIPDLPVLPRQTCRCTLAAIPSRLAATCTHSLPIS